MSLFFKNIASIQPDIRVRSVASHALQPPLQFSAVAAAAPNGTSREVTTFLFVLVLSGVDGVAARDAVRQTWMRSGLRRVACTRVTGAHARSASEATVRFFLGRTGLGAEAAAALEREQAQHGDLVLLDMADSYAALPAKVAAAVVWIDRHVAMQFLLKVVLPCRARALLMRADGRRQLRAAAGRARRAAAARHARVRRAAAAHVMPRSLYWGYFDGRAPVFRAGKWAEPVCAAALGRHADARSTGS